MRSICWPLVHGWLQVEAWLGNLHRLFLLLIACASALGGIGKWVLGRP